jgi:proline dehydrogenase
MRRVLLATSQNRWLKDRAPRYRFIQRAAARFMPGEDMEQALEAARNLQAHGIGSILTQLGENLTNTAEAEQVTAHYLRVIDRVKQLGQDVEISIKPTQLGLDQSPRQCLENLERLASHAAEQLGNFVWIDMEGSAYTDRTLELFQKARERHPNVGVCLQSYLYRTPTDLAALLPLGGGIRLVKGAYREPPEIAYPRKKDVDESYMHLALQLLSPQARQRMRPAFGTHDLKLIERIALAANESKLAKRDVEFELLYGIQRTQQIRLAQEGYRVRVLISYGSQWFPWFMRRLAERPANLGFVVRNLFS